MFNITPPTPPSLGLGGEFRGASAYASLPVRSQPSVSVYTYSPCNVANLQCVVLLARESTPDTQGMG